MKTSILTPLIAVCLALRSLANVIPRQNPSQPSLGRANASVFGGAIGAAMDPAISRRQTLLDSRGTSLPSTRKSRVLEAKKKDENKDDNDRRDIHHLNVSLFLKQFLHSFFERGLSRYSQDHFTRAGYPEWVRGRYVQISEATKIHKDFLESAITSAGSERVRPCNYEFDDSDVRGFVDQSAALGTISASAFTESLHNFYNRAYATASASMLAVEGRYAAWINSAVRKENPSNSAFETPLTPNQVATLLSRFIKFDSCPSENRDLLPEGYHPHPRLYLSPRLVPGEEAEMSFPYPEIGQGERLFIAFMAGAETIFARVTERENGKDDGSGLRNRNGNGQLPGGWPRSNDNDGRRNRNSGDNHDDNHSEHPDHGNGRENENNRDNHHENNREHSQRNHKDENIQTDDERSDNHRDKDDDEREKENDHIRTHEDDHNREDEGDRNRDHENDHNRKDENKQNGNGQNRDHETDHDRNYQNDRSRKDEDDHNRNHEKDNEMRHGNHFSSSNFASPGLNARYNNNRRFFVEIPRDLASKGSVFVVIIKGRDNIGEVRLDEASTVAGPAIANFPYDAWNNPIGH